MTDLETLLRETFAAHEHLADRAVAPLAPPRRSVAPLLAVAAVVVVVALAAGVVVLVNRDPGPGPYVDDPHVTSTPSPPDLRDLQRTQAEDQADLLLTQVAAKVLHFPGGAQSIDQAQVSGLANLPTHAPGHRTVVRSAYWATDVRDPSGVLAWFAQHPVNGFAVVSGPRRVEASGTAREELALAECCYRGPNPPPRHPPKVLLQAVPHGNGVAFRTTVILRY